MKSFGYVVVDDEGLLAAALSFANKGDAKKFATNLAKMDCEIEYRVIELFNKGEE